jgi:hypothetical protein
MMTKKMSKKAHGVGQPRMLEIHVQMTQNYLKKSLLFVKIIVTEWMN